MIKLAGPRDTNMHLPGHQDEHPGENTAGWKCETPDTPYTCPRCGAEAHQRFYGPCGACRREIVETYAERARGSTGVAPRDELGGPAESFRAEMGRTLAHPQPPAGAVPPAGDSPKAVGDEPAGGSVAPSRRTVAAAPAVTRRRLRPITSRRTIWWDWHQGYGVDQTGQHYHGAESESLALLLATAYHGEFDQMYLTGRRPHAGDSAAWHAWCYGWLPDGWQVHSLYVERPEAPVLRFRHEDGRRVDIRRASVWFGEDASPDQCRQAWDVLGELVAQHFAGGGLLATPATTGRELIAWSIPHSTQWPTLPQELQRLIIPLNLPAGQGRIEYRPPTGDTIPDLYEVDGRRMYPALTRELPGGPVEHWTGEHPHGPYARARVRAEWQVPDGWAHLGILPAHDGDTWTYPARPGERAAGWVDGVELHLARRHGWQVTVTESLVWPERADPLGTWGKRLLALMAEADTLGDVGELVAGAGRHIAIDAIGALVARPRKITRTCPLDQLPDRTPPGARLEGDQLVWTETQAPKWPEMAHPEWAAAVWARCRTRMLEGPAVHRGGSPTGALHVPVEHVLAIRTDALYLTYPPPWPDSTEPGRLRVKHTWPGPLPTPTDVHQLLQLRKDP